MNTVMVVSCVIAAWLAGAVMGGLVIARMLRNRNMQRPRPEVQTRPQRTDRD